MPEFSKAILARCAVVAARVEQNKEQLTEQLFKEVAEMELSYVL